MESPTIALEYGLENSEFTPPDGETPTGPVLELTHQLYAYARDLKAAYDAEQQRSRELERACSEMVSRLVKASSYSNGETGVHIRRIEHCSRHLARELDFDASTVELIAVAAPLHDVGNIGVPGSILRSARALSASEREIMETHCAIGARILGGSEFPLIETARLIALTHHERWDGSGYPDGLKGGEIPIAGRIVMLSDQYDVLRSRRPYKAALSHNTACDILLKGDGRAIPEHFDPRLLDVFRRTHRSFQAIYRKYGEDFKG